MERGSTFQKMLRELLLASGQFALFYILMNLSQNGMAFFSNTGHVALLGFLLVQTLVLVRFGHRPIIRFLGSLLAPLVYSALEIREGWYFVLNAAHIWFWIFSIATGGMQALMLATRSRRTKLVLEFVLTVTNVSSFLMLYFYFDTVRTLEDMMRAGVKNLPTPQAELTIGAIGAWLPVFLSDPTHIYILVGGALLALSLGVGRVDILRLKERINTLFGQYVDDDIRDRIIAGDEAASQNAELCILFADIRNFTGISESHDAEMITGMLNVYFSLWARTIRRHGGVVDKFIGDAVMAVFGLKGDGAPCDDAVACLVEMRAALPGLKKELAGLGLPQLTEFGVGIHFGRVVVGDIGSDERKNFTVIGDTVNVASRLESACKVLSTPCVISNETFVKLGARNQTLFKPLGSVRLKGKSRALKVFGLKPEEIA
jgi:class 3 adenylate cyclase